MCEEPEYIIITVGGDGDDDNDDNIVVIENSQTECTENTVSTDDVLPIQPTCQGDSDNSQPPFQISNGVECLAGLGDQPISQTNHPANIRRYNPDTGGAEFISLHQQGQSSVSMQDDMTLQDLIETTNKQVTQLCGIISKMQHTEEEEALLNRASPVVPAAGEPSLANTREMMGNHSMGPDTASLSVCIPPNIEMGKIAENSQKNNPKAMNCPTISRNNSGQCSSPSFICLPPEGEHYIFIEVPENEETKLEIYPGSLGNDSDLGTPSSTFTIQPPFDSSAGTRTETTIYPTLVPNDSKQEDTDSRSFFFTPGYDIFVKADNSTENNHETMISPIVLENNCIRVSSSSSDSIPLHSGYLGDPKRNVRILKVHLINAQRKPEPKHAARYLVRVLFSKEVLIRSTVGDNSYLPNPSCHQCLDPNKMAALREYLATAFPNHDLHECGKDWKACISYINSLIRYLCSEAKKTPEKTVVTTKRSTPVSVDLNDKRDGNGGEGSSQLPKQAAASETRASGNSQLNSSAVPKVFKEHCTGNSAVPYGALNYIGHPSRNVQVSYLVLNIAKNKACPQMSARYLIRHLFPKEALLTSSIYGNLWHGLCALNSNRINAIRGWYM
uniref:BEN domain containing 2 n=1 Tax=Molossus molossus TaxID=27622 RepID=A0A7J8J4K6_MOLMO|nr:BEN domain containing 2 [Molossus molossus]